MSGSYPLFKAAAVQAGPVFLDLDASIEKACGFIREAGANGARLIGFPESYVPGFPAWIFKEGPMGHSATLFGRLYQNAVEIPSKAVARLSKAARDAQIYVCISVTERERGSLYLAQLWFDPNGDLIAKHRKLKPTGPERYIWGEGDGSMLPVIPSPIGNLGGLLCWEHLVPLTSAAMSFKNEQVHVASWPVAAFVRGGPFEAMLDIREKYIGPINPADNPLNPLEVISRNYAMATQTFVLMCTHVMLQDAVDAMAPGSPPNTYQVGGGSSRIIAPDGSSIGENIPVGQEGLVYGNIPLEMVIYAKYMCDPGGHYAVPHILSLNMNNAPAPAAAQTGQQSNPAPMRYADIQETDQVGDRS
ncbi:carbon-nitrogen hydrolase family protein [Tardiphaga alba]|uniref:Carbon-nitrogen hydrolase family protein n=1 Tax=Tardiphaga alba TaxID=340268 RepID=A0ABX8ADT2_9BRAD|nr:carbon-nitrogen hydrolase family protein [Tardiphaga alba]QUS41926.1 carbon-nitrogen hydrolase family protein [Tardiphaga alba]